MSDTLPDAISDLCRTYGLTETEDMRNHLAIMLHACAIYQERDAHHTGLWKQYGAADTAHHLKSKAMRVQNNLAGCEDDAIDAINYAVFTLRNVYEGRM